MYARNLQPTEDYYSILNVDRKASTKEIKEAFFFLSRAFHPDKQTQLQEEANTQYPLIDRAYKILSNPITRKAYDDYGEEAIKAIESDEALNVAITTYCKNPDELEYLIASILRQRKQNEIMKQISYSNSFTSMEIDAQDFIKSPFSSIQRLWIPHERSIQINKLTLQHTLNLPVANVGIFSLTSYVISNQGLSVPGVKLTSHHALSHGTELMSSLNLGWSTDIVGEIKQKLNSYSDLALRAQLFQDSGFELISTYGQQLSKSCHGSVSFGPKHGISTQIGYLQKAYELSQSFHLSPSMYGLTSLFLYRLSDISSIETQLNLNTFNDIDLDVYIQKKFRNDMELGCGVVLGFFKGISLRLGFSQHNIRFSIPILLCPLNLYNFWTIVFSCMAPFVISASVSQILTPYQQNHQQKILKESSMKRLEYIAQAQTNANMQQKLMKRQADASKLKEQQTNGLIIMKASYGQFVSSVLSSETQEETQTQPMQVMQIDVAIPLQFYIKDSELKLGFESKSFLLGFYNPLHGQYDPRKQLDQSQSSNNLPQLYIRYAYKQNVYEITFQDNQSIYLPNRNAKYMGTIHQLS